MTGMTKLRDTIGALLARSPARWIVLSLVSVAVIGTAAYSYREIDNELTAVALSRREAVARLAAGTLAEKFGRVVDTGISLATRVRFRELVAEGKWNEAIEIMRAVPRDLPYIERLFLTDTKGTLRADVPALPGIRGVNLASHEWFQGVSRDWRPYVSSVYMRIAVPRLNVFAVAVPVKNATGGVSGILVLHIRIESLLEWIGAVDVGPEGFLYIVDSKGRLAFHSKHRNQQEIVDVSATPVVEKLRRAAYGVEIRPDPAEREDAIVAYAAVPGYGWGVIVQQPTRADLGLAARDKQLRRLVTGYGLLLLLGAATILLTTRIAVERQRAAERKQAEEEIRKSEEKYRTLFESAREAIMASGPDGKIVSANPAAARILGYSRPEDMIGMGAAELYADPEQRTLLFKELMTKGYVENYELEFKKRDGSPIFISINSSVVRRDKDGKILQTEGFIIDISERKRAERELSERAEELARSNKELEQFAYVASHDLQEPLRMVSSYSELLGRRYKGQLDADADEFIAFAVDGARRMQKMINDLLLFSRVGTHGNPFEPTDCGAVLDQVLRDIQVIIEESGAVVARDPLPVIPADAVQIGQVLQNLLANAIKFRGTNQPRIHISAHLKDTAWVFSVRDNGIGIDPQFFDRLFIVFQRLHSKEKYPGTGIGLAICKKIVERHGGRIWVESQPGKGATFFFAIPNRGGVSK